MQLEGKVAIVTGASAGIGSATARALAEGGAKLLLVARREDRLQDLQREIGGDTQILSIDLAEHAAAQTMLDHAEKPSARSISS